MLATRRGCQASMALAGKMGQGQGHGVDSHPGRVPPLSPRPSHTWCLAIYSVFIQRAPCRGLTTPVPQSSPPTSSCLPPGDPRGLFPPPPSFCSQGLPHSRLHWHWPQFLWERAGRRLPRWDFIPPFPPLPQGCAGRRGRPPPLHPHPPPAPPSPLLCPPSASRLSPARPLNASAIPAPLALTSSSCVCLAKGPTVCSALSWTAWLGDGEGGGQGKGS